jgi:hypothetical protein
MRSHDASSPPAAGLSRRREQQTMAALPLGSITAEYTAGPEVRNLSPAEVEAVRERARRRWRLWGGLRVCAHERRGECRVSGYRRGGGVCAS